MVRPLRIFGVGPCLPPKLRPLAELAYNLKWSWDHETIDLLRRLDSDLWETTGHNPIRMLGAIDQAKLEEAAQDDGFQAHLERVHRGLEEYLGSTQTWYLKTPTVARDNIQIAYFSAEFAITECLPFYSGGLGVLAGDHLKSASDLGLPLVGVGLAYQEGYFRQYLNRDGWQGELYPSNDFYNMPLRLERGADGTPLTVRLAFPCRQVAVQVWRAQVGRIPLLLLDTNLSVNSGEDQDITKRLYGGNQEMRLSQEIVLAVGGVRALESMGVRPTVCHINEGHAAFVGLERIRTLMEEYRLSFDEARGLVVASSVFTTHTPVPAGIDVFPPELVDRYLGGYYGSLGLSRDDFLGLGRQDPSNCLEPFSMAILAIRLAGYVNGVSKLHGEVSRRMWQNLWPGVPAEETPISYVTNGIHPLSWVSGHDMAPLFVRYLGGRCLEDPTDQTVWQAVERIPNEELWRTHERRRERLVVFARGRVSSQLKRRGAPPSEIATANESLDAGALTIGFARRFATYKRPTLLLRDPERLARILSNDKRPVQIIFAGKAHPNDDPGKDLIRQVVHYSRRDDVRRRIAFIEDYDLEVGRYLVQGADVWLNTPLRPLEACGTSGMKAAANGVLNVSVLDGWWSEACHPEAGWTIGRGEKYQTPEIQDEVESQELYDLLEKEVVPLFYDRSTERLPRKWIARMRGAMRVLCPVFNSNRMVKEYCERFYLAADTAYRRLTADGMARARALVLWESQVRQQWSNIHVASVDADMPKEIGVGAGFQVRAEVCLGELTPEDVAVELYYGPLDADLGISGGVAMRMTCLGENGGNSHVFSGSVPCRTSGLHGFALRIAPHHQDLPSRYLPGLVLWAS